MPYGGKMKKRRMAMARKSSTASPQTGPKKMSSNASPKMPMRRRKKKKM